MTDVQTERARIQAEIEGRTLVDALADTVAARGEEPSYADKHRAAEGETWRTQTWRETRELALDVAAALMKRGVEAGDMVAIMATNRIEHVRKVGSILESKGVTPFVFTNGWGPDADRLGAFDVSVGTPQSLGIDHWAAWDLYVALDAAESLGTRYELETVLGRVPRAFAFRPLGERLDPQTEDLIRASYGFAELTLLPGGLVPAKVETR